MQITIGISLATLLEKHTSIVNKTTYETTTKLLTPKIAYLRIIIFLPPFFPSTFIKTVTVSVSYFFSKLFTFSLLFLGLYEMSVISIFFHDTSATHQQKANVKG